MKPILLLIFVVLTSLNVQSKEKEKVFVYFKKKESRRSVKLKLPIACRMYEKGKSKRSGRIEKVKESEIVFSYYSYDTSDVNVIMNQDISRREKDKQLDSLINSTKVFKSIAFQDLEKIEILSSDASLKRKLFMLIGSVTFLGSGLAFMSSTSTHVGQKLTLLNWIEIGGMAAGAGTMALLTKQTFDMKKWRIEPVPTSSSD
jgi:hypothetical protein